MCFVRGAGVVENCLGDGGGDDLMTFSRAPSTLACPTFCLRSLRTDSRDDFLRAVMAKAYVSSIDSRRSRVLCIDCDDIESVMMFDEGV